MRGKETEEKREKKNPNKLKKTMARSDEKLKKAPAAIITRGSPW